MIGKLKGVVDFKGNDFIIVDVRGVGYRVWLNEVTKEKVNGIGERVELFIHTNVKEDHIHLYGFLTEEELKMFELLLSISGVGPKAGLAILTIASVEAIREAIANNNPTILTQVSGIGKKTAERICLELQNKVGDLPAGESNQTEIKQRALEALMAMGYSVAEAREALRAVPQEITDEAEVIKLALRKVGGNKNDNKKGFVK